MSLSFSKQKISSALQLVAEFESVPFPHTDSAKAVGALKFLLTETQSQLNSNASSDLISQTEMQSIDVVADVLSLLGIISNSSNVRNAFEIHGPVKKIVSKLLCDTNVNLIISFEWNYIPYTYPQSHPYLPSFVIIGLPASEASNPLVLPVIGHELGHSLWRQLKLRNAFRADINSAITSAIKGPFRASYERVFSDLGVKADNCGDLNNLETWADAADFALQQIEEIFSDLTGLNIFGRSYLDSFEYLLSPSLSIDRSPDYPSDLRRATYLVAHAKKMGIVVGSDFKSAFQKQESPYETESEGQLQMELADEAAQSLIDPIADKLSEICADRDIQCPPQSEIDEITECFKVGVPAQKTTGLGAILNAGWKLFLDASFMKGEENPARLNVIGELILKSVEVHEIEELTGIGT